MYMPTKLTDSTVFYVLDQISRERFLWKLDNVSAHISTFCFD